MALGKGWAGLSPLAAKGHGATLTLLPETLLERARQSPQRDSDAARLVMLAVAIDIALACPLRMKNLTDLRLDRNLKRFTQDGRLVSHIVIAATDAKGHDSLEWPVPPSTAKLIEEWLRDWRGLMGGATPDSPYLFPGQRKGTGMSQSALAQALKRTIAREIGCEVHPHLLRHFSAWRHLNRYPGQYEIVRAALGHASVETTIAFYCGLETEAAARVFQQGIEADRAEARKLVRLGSQRKTQGGAAKKGARRHAAAG